MARRGVAVRKHHGFAWTAMRQRVWSDAGVLLATEADSVHPPRVGDVSEAGWRAAAEAGAFGAVALETMYPGYFLGDGAALDWAMSVRLPVAVDIAHLALQEEAGVLSAGCRRRLEVYEGVVEVHVSAPAGRRDAHLPVTAGQRGLGWAREQAASGVPVVLECYMHRLSLAAREAQVAMLRGEG